MMSHVLGVSGCVNWVHLESSLLALKFGFLFVCGFFFF